MKIQSKSFSKQFSADFGGGDFRRVPPGYSTAHTSASILLHPSYVLLSSSESLPRKSPENILNSLGLIYLHLHIFSYLNIYLLVFIEIKTRILYFSQGINSNEHKNNC